MSLPTVLILGGGFAGLSAAKALSNAVQTGICTAVLVDGNKETAMIPALPDYAAGLLPQDWITSPILDLLPENICFDQTTVQNIRFSENLVETDSGNMRYDHLILTMGSQPTPPPTAMEGSKAYTLTNLRDAQDVRAAFEKHHSAFPTPNIVINGAGYTGIEWAICMARRARQDGIPARIHLVEQHAGIMGFLSPSQQRRVLSSIERHGIRLHTTCQIVAASDVMVELSNGTSISNPLVCRTEGTCSPVHTADTGVETLADGRLRVEPTLALSHYANVFVAGDAAAFPIPDGFLRKAVNFAYYAGAHAGRNVIRQITKRPLRPFRPIDLGWVIPLGDDSVGKALGGIPLAGKMGLRLHYVMCGYRNYSLRNFVRLTGYAARAGRSYKPTRRKEQA